MATEVQFLAGIGAFSMNTTSVTVGDPGVQIARLCLSTTSLQRHSRRLSMLLMYLICYDLCRSRPTTNDVRRA
jgi:hypothetical protein